LDASIPANRVFSVRRALAPHRVAARFTVPPPSGVPRATIRYVRVASDDYTHRARAPRSGAFRNWPARGAGHAFESILFLQR
jgi:hypothetical protein